MHFFIAGLVIVELYYWFVYFPRALRNGSNREINEIRNGIKFMKRFYKGE
jgi:hypothetical protein